MRKLYYGGPNKTRNTMKTLDAKNLDANAPEIVFYPFYKRVADRFFKENSQIKNAWPDPMKRMFTIIMLQNIKIRDGKLKIVINEEEYDGSNDIWNLDWRLLFIPWERKLLLDSCCDRYFYESPEWSHRNKRS